MIKVLIIEDEVLVAFDIQEMIEETLEANCCIAHSEDQAVSTAESFQPDIILSDFKLLQGTGYSAVKRITSSMGEKPTIYITANTELIPDTQGSRVLSKPISSHDLISTIRDIVPA